MASKPFPFDTLDQAADVLAACKQIDPDLKFGRMTQAGLADALAQAKDIQARIEALELQVSELRNKRDDQLTTLWDNVKRARSTVKGAYGDDSSEYKLVGGTRIRDRKKPTRRVSP